MATALPENSACFTLADVVAATGGTLLAGSPSQTTTSVGTDTRSLRPQSLFVALRGERYDAHDHLAAAVSAGASALVVREGSPVPDGAPAVAVPDTLRALADLARAWQRKLRGERAIPVLALSGAVGKTSTKELAAAAFTAAFGPTHATRGNLNNLVGAPLTVLGLTREHRALVVECGSNAPGEIARIAAMVEPDVAVCTNADAAHTEALHTVEAVADEEGSLYRFARKAVLGNLDEPLSYARCALAPAGVARWTFSQHREADVQVVDHRPLADGRVEIDLRLAGSVWTVTTAVFAPAHAMNFAAALGATALVGADRDGLQRACEALGAVPAAPGRMQLRKAPRWTVIDDTYNASPRALQAALEAAAGYAKRRGARLVVALGDMLELGPLSAESHRRAGALVALSGAAVFVAVGTEMALGAEAARAAGVATERAPTSTEGASTLRALVRDGDVVLVKGSRGVRMERCVEALMEGV